MRSITVIAVTIFIALVLSVLPLPESWQWYRPEWLCLVIIYWVMALPHRVGMYTGFAMGLLLDVLEGVTLGQHAVALTVVAFFSYVLHLRIRVFPIWQQLLMIVALVGVYLVITRFIQGIVGVVPESWLYWAPAISSAFFWPWVYFALRWVRQRLQVE